MSTYAFTFPLLAVMLAWSKINKKKKPNERKRWLSLRFHSFRFIINSFVANEKKTKNERTHLPEYELFFSLYRYMCSVHIFRDWSCSGRFILSNFFLTFIFSSLNRKEEKQQQQKRNFIEYFITPMF